MNYKTNKMKVKKILAIVLMSPIWCRAQIELEGNFIKATASGGIPPFTYNIDGGIFQMGDTIFNVIPGLHTVNARDAFGCIRSQSIRMYEPLTITLSSTRSNITATALGGKPPYTYSRNSTTRYQTSNVFTGLLRRTTYTIRVKDALGYVVTKTITTL
jgi:hypothetical protein